MYRKKNYSVYMLLILLAVALVAGCINSNGSQKNASSDSSAPQLKVYGEAIVEATILQKTVRENNIRASAVVKEIKDYKKVLSNDILLKEEDGIVIEFSGIGDKSKWASNNLAEGDVIQVNLRCFDSGVYIEDSFSCYWEGDDKTVVKLS